MSMSRFRRLQEQYNSACALSIKTRSSMSFHRRARMSAEIVHYPTIRPLYFAAASFSAASLSHRFPIAIKLACDRVLLCWGDFRRRLIPSV